MSKTLRLLVLKLISMMAVVRKVGVSWRAVDELKEQIDETMS